MIEKTLHSANIAAAFGVVATAADMTFCGGLATTIGAALSGQSLLKGLSKEEKTLAHQIEGAMSTAFTQAQVTDNQRKILAQMINTYAPSESHLAQGNFDAGPVTEIMRRHVTETASDPAHLTDTALNAYTRVMTDTLTPVLAEPAGIDLVAYNAMKVLLQRSADTGASDRLRDERITEKALIRLAQRIAGETEDVGQAWLELQNAMDIAVSVQKEGRMPSNHGDFVDTVLQRVAELSGQGDYAAAGAEIDAALEEAEAKTARLLKSGIEVALLDGDTAKAAALLVRQADLEAGGAADFEHLRALQDDYYVSGRDKGLNLHSQVAIDLAHLLLKRCSSADQRGKALDDLGSALTSLGRREADTIRLEQAVTAYQNALQEWTRDRVPLPWAITQTNLGNALRNLGEREADTVRLEQAVTAYQKALQERTRDGIPLQWATTQMNLGNALLTFGQRETGTTRLEQAVTAYQNALKEIGRDKAPLDWAIIQVNLANLHLAFFDKNGAPTALNRAAECLGAAREVFVEAEASQYLAIAEDIQADINARRSTL